jgi:hypothetical protein
MFSGQQIIDTKTNMGYVLPRVGIIILCIIIDYFIVGFYTTKLSEPEIKVWPWTKEVIQEQREGMFLQVVMLIIFCGCIIWGGYNFFDVAIFIFHGGIKTEWWANHIKEVAIRHFINLPKNNVQTVYR